MVIELAKISDIEKIAEYDRHIPAARLKESVENSRVYVLKTDDAERRIFGVLRYSLFWQLYPFMDLIFLDEAFRGQGFGSSMVARWENDMRSQGYRYVLTSTQADEDAWRFYEKLGYRKTGAFLPPEQEAEELIYMKGLEK